MARAIELGRALQAMEAAVDEKQLLVREMNHRIKNNLSLIAAMLSLQSRGSSDKRVRDDLLSAANRIQQIALVHDRLQLFSTSTSSVDASAHFREVCEMLRSTLPPGVALNAQCQGFIAADCIEPLTLIANELVTNAAKHAFKDRSAGEIELSYQQRGAGWRFCVRDNGSGVSPGHDLRLARNSSTHSPRDYTRKSLARRTLEPKSIFDAAIGIRIASQVPTPLRELTRGEAFFKAGATIFGDLRLA